MLTRTIGRPGWAARRYYFGMRPRRRQLPWLALEPIHRRPAGFGWVGWWRGLPRTTTWWHYRVWSGIRHAPPRGDPWSYSYYGGARGGGEPANRAKRTDDGWTDGRTRLVRGHDRKQSSRLLCGGFCYLECSPVPLSFARWRLYDVVPSPNLSATSIYIFAADH